MVCEVFIVQKILCSLPAADLRFDATELKSYYQLYQGEYGCQRMECLIVEDVEIFEAQDAFHKKSRTAKAFKRNLDQSANNL